MVMIDIVNVNNVYVLEFFEPHPQRLALAMPLCTRRLPAGSICISVADGLFWYSRCCCTLIWKHFQNDWQESVYKYPVPLPPGWDISEVWFLYHTQRFMEGSSPTHPLWEGSWILYWLLSLPLQYLHHGSPVFVLGSASGTNTNIKTDLDPSITFILWTRKWKRRSKGNGRGGVIYFCLFPANSFCALMTNI